MHHHPPSNVYEVNPEEYISLLQNSITTHYRKADSETENNINREAANIVKELNIADRVD